jgi:hypothetical protein
LRPSSAPWWRVTFVDHFGNWNVTFMLSMGVMVCGIVLSVVMKPDVAFADHRQSGTSRAGRETPDAALPLVDKR